MAKKPDTNEPGQTEESGKKSGGGLVGLLIVAAASLVSSFGLFYFLSPPAPVAAACPPADAAAAPAVKPLAQDQVYVEMKEILITIGSAPADRYLKLNLTIVTNGKDNAAKVKAAEPMLVDAFNNYLRSIELSNLEDPGFYPHLREQLARRSELVLGSAASNGVLITEFLLR